MKNKIATIGIIIATLILAGVAVFTAVRLYQLRQQAVAPTAPTSKPKAQEVPIACTLLTFTLGATPTPSPTPTGNPTSTPTATPTGIPGATSTPTTTPTTGAGTSTPTPTSKLAVAPTPTQPSLPDAGVSLPTIFGITLGSLLLIGAIILAL